MAQPAMSRVRDVGEYHLGRQIGSGSFSVVWHGRHRIHGTEVAIKEILMERLNKKLQDNLMSEILILKRINHPNIIRLHDIIDVSGKMYLVLEYCKAGDLSVYIQRHGRVTHATAKLFMQQLAAGLKILRDNNLIHRDLKPQNLLLSTNNNRTVLKIADFGFARSLQPKGLAETLCGSPLYMAPEIMQLQKYDAKADLWSVGAILFQLVTGKTPFTGNNQIQLLQNIKKSTQLHFPPDIKEISSDCRDLCQKLLRHNPVERLTFEEFFNHPFFLRETDRSLGDKRSPRTVDGVASSECSPSGNIHETSPKDSLPFLLHDDSRLTEGSSSYQGKKAPLKSTHGFCLQTKNHKETISNISNMELSPKYETRENAGLEREYPKDCCTNPMDQRLPNIHSKGTDSFESIDQDYVFVSEPQTSSSSSSASAVRSTHSQFMPEKKNPPASLSMNTVSTTFPMPIVGTEFNKLGFIGSLESQSSAPSGASQGSMDIGDAMEQNNLLRIKSLRKCASAVTDLVNKKVETGRESEAFSIQLVVLAIWKQALHGCQKQSGCDMQECISSQIQTEFVHQVEHAEELAKLIDPGNTEMPDAMETIYQSALAFGRHGAVDELMGDGESAEMLYAKAVELLLFLLLEAPSLNLNPPFSLTTSDRYRLRTYIAVLRNRQRPDRMPRLIN